MDTTANELPDINKHKYNMKHNMEEQLELDNPLKRAKYTIPSGSYSGFGHELRKAISEAGAELPGSEKENYEKVETLVKKSKKLVKEYRELSASSLSNQDQHAALNKLQELSVTLDPLIRDAEKLLSTSSSQLDRQELEKKFKQQNITMKTQRK